MDIKQAKTNFVRWKEYLVACNSNKQAIEDAIDTRLDIKQERFMKECIETSTQFDKCELCEFRFKCYTMKHG